MAKPQDMPESMRLQPTPSEAPLLPKTKAVAGDDASLTALRERIDALDRELLALLNQRAQLAMDVGELKKRNGTVVFRPEREAQVIAGLRAANVGPLQEDSVGPIWREIMSACRAKETPTRVAYLGPAGTLSEEATLGYFGSSIVKVPCANLDEVFHMTACGAADFGVVPAENSSEGVVARTLDLLRTTPLFIIAETSLTLRHNLLRASQEALPVEAVVAHAQTLAQCHVWLSAHLPHAERRPVASNAEGARLAAMHPGLAAIASSRAATEYGLHGVAKAIQDDVNNRTRFVVITDPHQHPMPAPSGHDCTSLIVSVTNRPGALHDLLLPLSEHGVSLSRFESRPARSGQWEYDFHIDVQGHADDPVVAAALRALRTRCAFFKVLGSYPLDMTR